MNTRYSEYLNKVVSKMRGDREAAMQMIRRRQDTLLIRSPARPAQSVVMLVYSNRSAWLKPVFEVNSWYATHHAYELIHRSVPTHPLYASPWQKVQLVLDYVEHFLWTFHLDDDAFVAKPFVPVETFTQVGQSVGLIAAAHDCHSCRGHLNTGVWISRATPWLVSFLRQLLQDKRCAAARIKERCCWEQECAELLLTTTDLAEHATVLQMGHFACQPGHRSYAGICDPWVYHALGQGRKQSLLGKARATSAWLASIDQHTRVAVRDSDVGTALLEPGSRPPLDLGMEADSFYWRRVAEGEALPQDSFASSVLLRNVAAARNWSASAWPLSVWCRGLCAHHHMLQLQAWAMHEDGVAASASDILTASRRPDRIGTRCALAVHDISSGRCLLFDEPTPPTAAWTRRRRAPFRAWARRDLHS